MFTSLNCQFHVQINEAVLINCTLQELLLILIIIITIFISGKNMHLGNQSCAKA